MSNLLYVGLAAVLTAIGCVIIWLRHRKPRSMYSGIDEFNRELRALSPDRRQDGRG